MGWSCPKPDFCWVLNQFNLLMFPFAGFITHLYSLNPVILWFNLPLVSIQLVNFPILFWLHNFHGSQTFWVKTPSFQHLVSPFPKPGAQAPQGQPGHGGRCDGLHDVVELVSNHMAFAAIVAGASCRVVTWGNAECGGVTSESLRDPWAGQLLYISITTFFLVLEDLEPIFLWKNVIARSIPRKAMACEVSVPHDDISAWASWRSPGSIERRGQSWSVQPGLCCHSARRNCRRLGWCWVGWPLASAWNFVVICVIWYLDDIWGEIG